MAFRYPIRRPVVSSARPAVVLIAVVAVVLIALVWLGALHATRTMRAGVMDSAILENRNRVIAFEHFIGNALDTADAEARHAASQPRAPAEAWTEESGRRFAEAIAANSLFSRIDIADANGVIRWSSRREEIGRSVAAGTPFRALRAAPTQPRPVIGDPVRTPGPDRGLIGLSRPIHTADGGFGGMLTIWVGADRLTGFYQGADFRPHDLVSVIRLDGLTLARREGAAISFGQNLAGTLVMREQLARPNGTYIGPSVIDGIKRVFSHRRIDRYGLFVTVGVGIDDVFTLSDARARLFFAAIAALSLSIALAGWLLALGLLRRERTIRDLAATNDRLRESHRIGGMGDWEYNVEAQLLVCSDELCRLHGRDPARDMLNPAEALDYHPRPAQTLINRTMRAAITTGQQQSCEIASTLGDGRPVDLRIRMSPIVDPDGRVRTVLGIEQDITIEKRHERLRAQVGHLARVEAMNVMAATIAHELSQPLTAASNYLSAAEFLSNQPSINDAERVAVLLAQANRQIGLTGQIIRRAREMVADRGFSEVASLEEIVADAVALSRAANPELARVHLASELAADTGHVAADKVQIQQVLLNLVRNAAEAVADVDEPQIRVTSCREAEGMVRICVLDNGPGIPQGADIFSPSGSDKADGLGIGLSICRALVDSYGGRIWSEPSQLGGAAICFTLPLDELAMLYKVA